ncbi:MAG: argininosuccinate lyase [Spirochaetaceae bacterium]|nr:argininosuccinate lyase [Spirochaetaceae bacterium]
MAKLWQKNYELDSFVEHFTVGNDYILDDDLVVADCLSSIAHAKMLLAIKIISKEDFDKLQQGLIQILELQSKKEFPITLADEDCHTAIENYLVEKIGEAGKRIHTGRSRNDQVLTALRVFGRSKIISIMETAIALIESLIAMGQKHSDVPMAGRTHMQIAMPSSIGLWAMSFAEELLDCMKMLEAAYHLNNQSPLGSAASFGVPLPLDRKMSSELLGFEKVQNNVLYCNNSRGKIESIILDALEQFMLTISKIAQELIIYSMPEFGYFSLPAKLCSGSSIMPQKKNPDVLELLRAKAATMGSYSIQIKNIIRSLPSGYNRDFQETKGAFMKGLELAHSSIGVTALTISNTEINAWNLKKGFIPEIYATDAALKLVAEGMSFRDAYKEVGLNIDKLKDEDPESIIKKRTSEGTTGKLNIDIALSEKEKMEKFISNERIKNNKVSENLTGKVFQIA